MAVANARTVLPMLSDFLEIDESMYLCVLCHEVKTAVRQWILSNSYKKMRVQQHENAFLAKSLFATDWSTQINQCGLLDCRKPCGRWMPSIRRNSNGRMIFDNPAPACDPKISVIDYMYAKQGRYIVTCSPSCCKKAWTMLQVIEAAQRYNGSRYYTAVLRTCR